MVIVHAGANKLIATAASTFLTIAPHTYTIDLRWYAASFLNRNYEWTRWIFSLNILFSWFGIPFSMVIHVWAWRLLYRYLFDNDDNETKRREKTRKIHSSKLVLRTNQWQDSLQIQAENILPLDFCWQSERKSQLMAIEWEIWFLFHSFELNATYALQMTCF